MASNDDLARGINDLSESLKQILSENKSIGERLTNLETKAALQAIVEPQAQHPINEPPPDGNQAHENGDGYQAQANGVNPQLQVPIQADLAGAAAGSPILVRDVTYIQQEYTVIKDALQRIKLPNDLKVDDTRQGVQRKDQKRLNILSRCARYGETMLKLLSTIDAESISQGDINDLVTIATAQVRYLQEEHALLLVNNSFGDNVETLYRNFRRNTSQFPPDAIDALQAAVTLSNHQEQHRGRGRGYSNFPRGRGAPRGRGYYGSQQGGRVPPYRPDNINGQGNAGNNEGM